MKDYFKIPIIKSLSERTMEKLLQEIEFNQTPLNTQNWKLLENLVNLVTQINHTLLLHISLYHIHSYISES